MSMKIICLSVRMLYILVLCPVLLASVLTLTIDSQLGTSIEDCFERISIGEQLPSNAIYRNVSELTTKECEQICKQDKQCQTYDYGVGAKGNATCDLSKVDEKELKETCLLQKHPDYDVYVRRILCEQSPPSPLGPQYDDPGDGPQHRPVFRPDADEKRPIPDFPPLDYGYDTLRPKPYPSGYGPQRPNRPFNNYIENDRPDDYDNFKPDYDRPPSYGAHKPQDIPYRPERPPTYGIFKPHDVPYRPDKPPTYGNNKPQDVPDRPPMYGDHRPQDIPYRPERPPMYGDHRPQDIPYRPERPPQYGDHRPQDIPYRPERPPTYGDHKPQDTPYRPDGPPTYGDHKPQDIPYRPERPPTYGDHKPQDIPYKPERPYNQTYKPDPYDVLQFQDTYGRPRPPPGSFRPDPHYPSQTNDDIPDLYGQKPVKPQTFRPEHPQYVYIIRPNRKPYQDQQPQEDTGYGNKPVKPEYPTNSYTQNDAVHPSRPIGPPSRPYRPRPIYEPSKPNDKPSYSYDEQYASNYGANNYQDNSIYVEIYDPPRPYRPVNVDRPYSGGIFGYGTQSYGNHNAQSSESSSMSSSSYAQNRPIHDTKPQKPSYGNADQFDHVENSYGSQKPNGNKPAYGVAYDQGYGSQNQAVYGETLASNQYGSSASYDSSGYGNSQKGQGYGSQSSSQYGSQASYGSSQYGSQSYVGSTLSDSGFGQHNSVSNQYGSSQNNQASYGSQSNTQYSSGQSIQASYGSQSDTQQHQSSYNQYESSNQNNHASYGQSVSSHYGQQQNDHDNYNSNSGYNQQSSNRPSYGSNQPSPSQHDTQPGYGLSNQESYNKPSFNRPAYGSNQDSLQDTGYGSSSKGSNNRRPTYGSNQASLSQQDTGYGSSSQGAQGSNSEYNRPVYNNKAPNNKPSNNKTGNESNRPEYHPVYEFDYEKPSNVPSYLVGPNGEIVTSRPVTIGDYESGTGYGRNPGGGSSYKACFRRVLAGRRALRSHVRRVLHCEQLEDCRRECALEKRFHCESFNYRLDPSFRGKGLCELMTKPIEAFDLHQDFVDDKDYDFYELDRNSLEPNCLDTLRRPGLLHSGYLSSKPSNPVDSTDRWSDRADWYGGYNDYKYQEDRRSHRFSNRRYEDQSYIPYQIGIARTNDDENWGQYGGIYGGYDRYYKDRNDYHKSINHWRLADERTYSSNGVKPYGAKPDFNYHSLAKSRSWDGSSYGSSYGSWRRGWSSSGSSNSLSYEAKPTKHYWIEAEDRSDDAPVKDCSSRRRPGMSLGSGAIRRSLYARNVVECEAACFGETEFKCVSYSYRYSSSHGTDNCFLSERPYKGLEMSADSGSDVYAMPQDQDCGTISRKPWIESECFWHVRSGAAVSGAAVRTSLTVTGLGACEAECIRARAFFCRGFSFRFDSPSIGDDAENCVLTSTPPTSLAFDRGLRPTAGHELYARGNYGRGCEPALYDDVQYRDTQCYLKYDNAAKLTPAAVRGRARAKDERACGATCTAAPFRCLSFSFRSTAPPDKDNCFLSEIRLFDLQRGVDYEHSADDWLFAFDLFNGQCWKKVHGKEFDIPSLEVPRPLSTPTDEEHDPPSRPDVLPPVIETYISSPSGPGFSSDPEPPVVKPYIHERPPFKPYPPETGLSAPSGPEYKPPYPPSVYLDSKLPNEPYPPTSYDKPYIPPIAEYDGRPKPYPERPYYKPSSPSGFKPEYLPSQPSRPFRDPIPAYPERPSRPIYGDREDNEIIASWRHYTVSGFPCRKGTTCAQNKVAGHWACEPEGGEIGSWDYCCAPTHRCGYSEGFQKPWCYVGPENDQWRPCSEKYYPYHQHKVPHPSLVNRDEPRPPPSRPHRERPGFGDRDTSFSGPYLSDADRKYWDELYKNGPQAYYDKYGNPLPGYVRIPTEERPYIKYRPNNVRPESGTWIPVPPLQNDQPTGAGKLGVPRYWPVAYLHKGPPPNITYFRYDETNISAENYHKRDPVNPGKENTSNNFNSVNINKENSLESRTIDDSDDDYVTAHIIKEIKNATENSTVLPPCKSGQVTTTQKIEVKETTTETLNETKIETTTEKISADQIQTNKPSDVIHGIDDKLHDFTTSIEIFDIEDAKPGAKASQLKTVEAEERQIEAIGRLLASRRGGKVVLEKRSQKDLETKKIAVDNDFVDFNFGNKFNVNERRGKIQKVSKDDIEKERIGNDKSLEVSETTFVRPPRVLSTTENIRKAIINGKVFYDATLRDQRELFSNSTRKPKSLRLEESRAPSVITNSNAKKKTVRARNINPIRRVRRVYRKRYNPEEVRKRLLEREKNKTNSDGIKS